MSAIEGARISNKRTAAIKDWRLTKKGLRLREIARQALTSDCLIGTASQIKERFPEAWGDMIPKVADHDIDEVFAWAIVDDSMPRRTKLSIACIGGLDQYFED